MSVLIRWQKLSEETWGQRLRRAREMSGLSLSDVADQLKAAAHPAHQSTLCRLERMTEAPTHPGQAATAAMMMITCGFNPEDWGLDPAQVLPFHDLKRLAAAIGPAGRRAARPPSRAGGLRGLPEGESARLPSRKPACATAGDARLRTVVASLLDELAEAA